MSRLTVLLASAAICAGAPEARAGGMLLSVRGVRTVERAGALIAGSDDADSLWLDPAGLAHLAGDGRTELLFDVAYVGQDVDHPDRWWGNRLAAVSNQQSGSPDSTATTTARSVTRQSASRARPSSIYMTFGAAYRVTDRLRIGATVTDVVPRVVARMVLSGCPGQTVCAPEDPDFDALTQDTQTDYISPSGSIGLQHDVARPPRSAFLEGARVVGSESEVSFTFPPQRFAPGVELRPTPAWCIEAAASRSRVPPVSAPTSWASS